MRFGSLVTIFVHLEGIDMLGLEQCPYCGASARFYSGGSYVECTAFLCGARGPTVMFVEQMCEGETAEKEAIESWNIVAELANRHFS